MKNLIESINKQRKIMGLNELENTDSLNEAMFDKFKTNVAGVGSFFTGKGFEQGKLKKQVKFNNRDISNNLQNVIKATDTIRQKVDANNQLTTKLTSIKRDNVKYQRQSANMDRILSGIESSLTSFNRYLEQLSTIN